MKKIKHQLSDKSIYTPTWDVKHLFIGTFNPEGGDEVGYYYGRSKNQTWKLISRIFKDEFDPDSPNFLSLLKKHHLGCIDMIHEVIAPSDRIDRIIGKGYKDSEIINKAVTRTYNTLLIQKIIKSNPNIKLYSTWGKGSRLSEWRDEIEKLGEITPLASPSLAARVPEGMNKFEFMLTDWGNKIKF